MERHGTAKRLKGEPRGDARSEFNAEINDTRSARKESTSSWKGGAIGTNGKTGGSRSGNSVVKQKEWITMGVDFCENVLERSCQIFTVKGLSKKGKERRKCVGRVNLFPFSSLPRYDYTIRVPANVATIVGLVYA